MINEYLDNTYAMPLKRYMNMSDGDKAWECCNRCPWLAKDFIENNEEVYEKVEELMADGKLTEDLFDLESYEFAEEIGDLFNGELSEYADDLVKYVSYQGGTEIPLFCVADYVKDIHNEWLVHMTDNYSGVWHEGFNVGVEIDDLAYTPDRGGTKWKYGPGYNFAFEADQADVAERSGYGEYCILFQASGVEIYHYGDEQYQVIFYGPTAKNLIFIEKPDYGDYAGMWCIEDEQYSGRYLCHFDDLQDAVYWAINNFPQYMNHLTGRAQPKRFERNIQKAKEKKMATTNENKTKTIILREEQVEKFKDKMDMTPDKFNSNIRYFLHQLMADPVNAQPPTSLKMAGITRGRLLKLLIKRGIIERHEKINDKDNDGNLKTATMKVSFTVKDKIHDEVEYKVPKTDFDRKVEKLRREIFEKNVKVNETKFNTRLGDQIAIAKNSPLTMGFIAPPEDKNKPDNVAWLANRAAEAWNAEIGKKDLDEDGGGATSAGASGQFSQPLFGTIRRTIQEAINDNVDFSNRYRDLGGGFDVPLEDGSTQKSLVTIQNKSTKTLYHICFDGGNFNIFRDMRNGEPCEHVSYVFDNLLDAFENNGYVNVNEMSTKPNGRVFKISEEQMKAIEEATATTTVGDYTYDVPLGVDPSDETMKRHNGEGGSVSINHIRESKNYVNMDVDIRDGGRHAVKMTVDEFKQEMIHTYHMYAMEREKKYKSELQLTPSPGNFVYSLCYKNRENEKSKYAAQLYKDIWGGKYKFDSENVDDRGGIKMSSKGFPYIMCCAGGDWERPVCFFVYFDGTHFRGYVPLKGNTINRNNNTAFQDSGDEEETKFIAKETGLDYEEAKTLTSDIKFNEDACLKDFLARVEVKGSYKKRDYTKEEERFKEYRKEKIADEKKRSEEAERRRQMNTQENNGETLENTVTSLNEEKENFFEKHGIKEVCCGLGYSEKEEKWYGWSHRAIQGFGIGDKFRECYPHKTKEGKTIKTLEQAKEAAKRFAESVS